MKLYPIYREVGANFVNGPETWSAMLEKICAANEYACEVAKNFMGEGMTVKSMELFEQLAMTDRFQEYKENFSKDNMESNLVSPGLASISGVPI